ncbi:hypothetical protein CRYUN_Cryun18bG0061900 [Craigia yunnanensis]
MASNNLNPGKLIPAITIQVNLMQRMKPMKLLNAWNSVFTVCIMRTQESITCCSLCMLSRKMIVPFCVSYNVNLEKGERTGLIYFMILSMPAPLPQGKTNACLCSYIYSMMSMHEEAVAVALALALALQPRSSPSTPGSGNSFSFSTLLASVFSYELFYYENYREGKQG